jgi:hypothetical protein
MNYMTVCLVCEFVGLMNHIKYIETFQIIFQLNLIVSNKYLCGCTMVSFLSVIRTRPITLKVQQTYCQSF